MRGHGNEDWGIDVATGAVSLTLADARVLDLSGTLAGAYCTKMLADAGADVVVAEGHPAVGSDVPGPRWPSAPGLFEYLHTSKRSIWRSGATDLAPSADIVVAGDSFDVAGAQAQTPRQVVVTITAYGTTGPWATRPATEFTMQAEAGSTGGRGLPEDPPLAAGGRVGEWVAGAYAAVGALGAWWQTEHTGSGGHVDVSIFECMVVAMTNFRSIFAEFAATCGLPTAPARGIQVPSIEPTADGWVTFTANSAQQFADFGVLIGHPEISEDERFAPSAARFEHRQEFWAMVRAYTRPRPSATVLEEAGLLRIPIAPVLDGSTVGLFEQFVERRVFVAHPSGRALQPRIPFRVEGVEPRPFGPVPAPGAHDGRVDWSPASRPSTSAPVPASEVPGAPVPGGALPLAGVRVVDLTAWWAGPSSTQALASLGAEVVKVESASRPDLMRCVSMKAPGDPQWWEWGPMAHGANTNKRAITLDLTQQEGRDLLVRLCQTADLLVENFTPRVMDQFGLTWDVLHAANPRLSMIRMPAFGLDGPWRDRPGFAQTMESLSGLAAATGWPAGSPVLVGGACDPLAGLHAAFAAMVALVRRERDGVGSMVEATMVEAALNIAVEPFLAFQLTGEIQGRRGNRSGHGSAPQGVYPGAGEDCWLALEVETDDQWVALVGVLGEPAGIEWGRASPDQAAGRLVHHDALDAWLAATLRRRDPEEVADELRAAGVPAAVVIHPKDITANPQLVHRGLFQPEGHPVTGDHLVPGLPFSMTGVGCWLRSPAPLLGQDNDAVLDELGVDGAGRARLRRQRVIGEELRWD